MTAVVAFCVLAKVISLKLRRINAARAETVAGTVIVSLDEHDADTEVIHDENGQEKGGASNYVK